MLALALAIGLGSHESWPVQRSTERAPVGEVTVRPHRSYQLMLGVFSVVLVLFGI